MSTLTEQILKCRKCITPELRDLIQYKPVHSFGNPKLKSILVVGINPSTQEFKKKYLIAEGSNHERLNNQLTYFERPYYSTFFGKIETFFDGEIKQKLGWVNSPWEKIAFLDLVKCSTKTYCGQWSSLKSPHKKAIIKNCENYLLKQMNLYKPNIILGYGKPVCEWFSRKYNFSYKNPDSKIISTNYIKIVNLILVYQKQGAQPHTSNELTFVKNQLIKNI